MPFKDKLGPKCSHLDLSNPVDSSTAVELRRLLTPKLSLSKILDLLLSTQGVDHYVELVPYYAGPLYQLNLTDHGLVSHPAASVLQHYLAQAVLAQVNYVPPVVSQKNSVQSLVVEVLEFAAEVRLSPHHALTLHSG